MDPDSIVILLAALALSAFFSGIEIAFVSANKLRLAIHFKEGGITSRFIQKYQNNPASFISATLVGNNFALVIYSMNMEHILSPWLQNTPSSILLHPFVNNVLITLISSIIVLLFAEFLPKILFRLNPIGLLHASILPFRLYHILFWPLINVVVKISNLFLMLLTGRTMAKNKTVFTPKDLGQFVQETAQVSLDHEKTLDTELFRNALDFHQIKVRDCMRPRTEIVAMDESEGIEALYSVFITSGHSKIPIFRDHIDNIIGYVHQGALFQQPQRLDSIVLPVVIVNETMQAADVLKKLTFSNKSLALVVDEFGGTAGIITIEDIMEEIFGEIEDEYDSEVLKETVIKPGHYLFSAHLEIEYLNKTYPVYLEQGDYETLGGYILFHANKVPAINEKIIISPYEFKVLSIENARINEVEMKRI
jgi:putative hemolysin